MLPFHFVVARYHQPTPTAVRMFGLSPPCSPFPTCPPHVYPLLFSCASPTAAVWPFLPSLSISSVAQCPLIPFRHTFHFPLITYHTWQVITYHISLAADASHLPHVRKLHTHTTCTKAGDGEEQDTLLRMRMEWLFNKFLAELDESGHQLPQVAN